MPITYTFVAGWNRPGYLPDNDPTRFEDTDPEQAFLSARACLLDAMGSLEEDLALEEQGWRDECPPGCRQGSHIESCESYEQIATCQADAADLRQGRAVVRTWTHRDPTLAQPGGTWTQAAGMAWWIAFDAEGSHQ